MIFLVGYRGTGKTTVAELLAERVGWPWLDADAVLEARHGRSIAEIFARDGETAFRDMEAAILKDLCRLHRHVVATGGGVVLREMNHERMRQAGPVVWLTADPDTIWTRIQADSQSGKLRPPLTVGGQAEVEQLLTVREPMYRACADVTVNTASKSPEQVVDEILTYIAV